MNFSLRTNNLLKYLFIGVSLTLYSCSSKKEVDNDIRLFTTIPASHSGITFNNKIKDTEEANILLYANFYGGAGVGICDVNNDGLKDIFFAGNNVPDRLYLNQGDFTFKDITKEAGILDDGGWSTGVTVADINNDGYSDIYVSRELHDEKPEWRKNLLYINNGDNTFTEQAADYHIADSGRTRHATFLDYDKDGKLDLFLLTQPPNPGSLSQFSGSDLSKEEYSIRLYRNLGIQFEDVTKVAGLLKTGFPNGVSASDINNDGWTDIYVANDFEAPDFLFINNQDGTFTDIAKTALNQTSFYSMGIDIADINNDALLDIFVLDMVAEDNFRLKSNMSGMDIDAFWKVVNEGGGYQYMYNSLQINNGNTTFSNVAQFSGMAATDWSWSNLLADFDNDGYKDAYITNGLYRDIRNTDADKKVAEYINQTRLNWLQKHPDGGGITSIWEIIDLEKVINLIPSQPLKNYAFQNTQNLSFENVSENWGLDQESFSNGSAYADLDNDGDLDLVVNNINEEAFILENNASKILENNYLRIRLIEEHHKSVFGTRVYVYTDGKVQMQETTNVRGIYSTSESEVHFGLGKASKIDSLVIEWPFHAKTTKLNVAANQHLDIYSSKALPKTNTINQKESVTLFENTTDLDIKHKHTENDFDDYAKQTLLPHKLSQLGPALAVADVNNDGQEDVFIGGAAGESPKLYLQQSSGSFSSTDNVFWTKEKAYEDVDAHFADFNADGFVDLYVVSGGNQYPKNDPHYIDRVYMNNGDGKFVKGAILNVNRVSGSAVSAADYDNDGDTDLFVSGRHTPHQYPTPTSSSILENVNGQLVDVSSQVAPELKDIGMITDAVWSDFDSDGDFDLIAVGEWMPVTVFVNEGGKLIRKAFKDLENTSGWWFRIAKGDFDADGDDDYIIGNLGLNQKYKTSKDTPFDIYYDDFDANGSNDIVLGYYNKGKHFPLRGFSCSSEQIPELKENFKKYDVFASLELNEVYGEANLKNALRYEVQTFESIYLENKGTGNFKITPLPYLAQLSNINDILVDDYNNDGHLDLLGIGNLFDLEIESPRNDAGTGILLVGDGSGKFSAIPSKESGFFANKNAKKIKRLRGKNATYFLVANNNDSLQIIKQVRK